MGFKYLGFGLCRYFGERPEDLAPKKLRHPCAYFPVHPAIEQPEQGSMIRIGADIAQPFVFRQGARFFLELPV